MPIMKRENNLLDSVGRDWFARRVVGGYMLYNGNVCRILEADGDDGVFARQVDHGNNMIKIPKHDITGFSAFAYPQLGYRMIERDRVAMFVTKRHSYERGLRRKNLNIDLSPVSDMLIQQGVLRLTRGAQSERDIMTAVFAPRYGTPEDIERMLDGELLNVVLSADVLIEPSVCTDDDDYVVYFRRRAAGRLINKKKFKWYNPAYEAAIAPLVGKYGEA